MAEYIDRTRLLDLARHDAEIIAPCKHTAEDIIDMIRASPAADVEPVRHGRWLLVRQGEWTAILKCSQCGRCITIDTRTEDLDGGYPYCHCGAKMDGEA